MTGLSAINFGSFSSAMGGAFAKNMTEAKFSPKMFATAFSAGNIKDEYTPRTATASKTTFSAPVRGPVNASSVDAAIKNVMQSAGLSEEDYFNFALAIDGSGRFHSGGGIINQNAYNWDTKEQEKLGEIIDGLNRAVVKGRFLGEVMLEQFAQETGLNLVEERKKDSFYYTCVVYNSGISETRSNPDDIASMSNSFATIMRQRVTAGDGTFYEQADKPKMGASGLDNNLKALADWQFCGFDFNDSNAPWNQYNVEEGSFKPLSLTAEIQQVSSPISDMMRDLNRRQLEDLLTEILEANGVNFKNGDSIALLLDEKGKLSINMDKSCIGSITSRLDSKTGDETGEDDDLLWQTIRTLTNALNSAETPNGVPLGAALLEQFAAENVGTASNDKDGSFAFSFQRNAEVGRNEIGKVRWVEADTKETITYVYMDWRSVWDAFCQILEEEYGYSTRGHVWAWEIDKENKTISFDRELCWISGLNDDELNDVFTKIEDKVRDGFFTFFESSRHIKDVGKWDDVATQNSGSSFYGFGHTPSDYVECLENRHGVKWEGGDDYNSRLRFMDWVRNK